MPAATRFIALLRAINVGGHVVTMDRLRRVFASLGFGAVETFIASGNVVFESGSRNAAALERKVEKALRAALGYEVATFIRTGAELAAIAAYEPFRAADLEAAKAHCIGFVADPLDAAAKRKLMALRTDVDDFHVRGREIYWLSHVRQGESTFSNAVFEKTLGRQATFRGVNTVRRLAAKYGTGERRIP